MKYIKLALIAFLIWYVVQDASRAGAVGNLAVHKAVNVLSTAAHAGKDFLDGLLK